MKKYTEKSWHIFNASSEDMSEVPDHMIDLVVVAPHYNIGTVYGNFRDKVPFDEYQQLMGRILSECVRVLSPHGVLFLEAADSILSDGLYVQLADMLQFMCLERGLHLFKRNINYVHSKKGIVFPEDSRWNSDYTTKQDAHSNCHQWMAFSKRRRKFQDDGNVFHLNYRPLGGHPCPFTNAHCKLFLDSYFQKGYHVLEAFMGTAKLGTHVLRRGGTYWGYEIDSNIFEKTKRRLKRISLAEI